MTDQPDSVAVIPSDLFSLAKDARTGDALDLYEWDRVAMYVLAAVLPEHERQVRAKVVAEIEKRASRWAHMAHKEPRVTERERRYAIANALNETAREITKDTR